jgi:pyrroloquinoline quinone biosynthesis protein E
MLTGDAANADPVCDKSPHHHVITDVIDRVGRIAAGKEAAERPILFRNPKNSKALIDAEAKKPETPLPA